MSINVAAAMLQLFINFFAIKFFGDTIYGIYVTLNLWVNFIAIFLILGMDDYFVMQLPKLFSKGHGTQIFQIWTWSLRVSAVAFSGVSFILLLAIRFGWAHPVIIDHSLFFFLLLAGTALINLYGAFLRGIHRLQSGQVLEKLLRPFLFILISILFWFFKPSFTFQDFLVAAFLSMLVLIPLYALVVRKAIPSSYKNRPAATFDKSLRSNLTFTGISLLYLLSTRLDLFFLSYLTTPAEVGYYNMAARFADFIGYPQMAIALLLPPLISKALHEDKARISTLLRMASTVCFAFVLIGTLGLAFLVEPILSFLGEGFLKSFLPMLILAATHLIASFAIPLNSFLMVSGGQSYSFFALSISMLVTLILCAFLVSLYGSLGAACSILCGNVAFYFSVRYFYIQKNIS